MSLRNRGMELRQKKLIFASKYLKNFLPKDLIILSFLEKSGWPEV